MGPSAAGRLFSPSRGLFVCSPIVLWVAVLLAVLILIGIGWQLAELGLERVYPITRISQTWAWAAVPLGSVLMLLYLIEQAVTGRVATESPAGTETA